VFLGSFAAEGFPDDFFEQGASGEMVVAEKAFGPAALIEFTTKGA